MQKKIQWVYSDELADTICEQICERQSFRAVCDDLAMPDEATIIGWLDRHPYFLDLYNTTIFGLVEDLCFECVEIADSCYENNIDGCTLNLPEVRLKIEVRHWIIEQLEQSPRYDKSRGQLDSVF